MRWLDKIVDSKLLTDTEETLFKQASGFKKAFDSSYDESFKKSLLANLEGEQRELYRELVLNLKLTVAQLKETVGLSVEQIKVKYNIK
jgi:hypothetical protein